MSESIRRSERPRDDAGRYQSKLTPELHDKIVLAIRAGAPIQVAADQVGVWRTTFQAWLRQGKGELDSSNGDLQSILETKPHAALAYAVNEAQANFVVQSLALIYSAGRSKSEGQWQALAWMLERRFPHLFGRTTRHEHSGTVQVNHNAIMLPDGALEALDTDELAVLHRLVGKMQGEVYEVEDADVLELEPGQA